MRPIGDASNPRQGGEVTRGGRGWGYNNNEGWSDTTTTTRNDTPRSRRVGDITMARRSWDTTTRKGGEEGGEEYNEEGIVTRTRTEVDTSNPTTSARLCAAYHSIPTHIITHNPRSTPPWGQYIYLLINVWCVCRKYSILFFKKNLRKTEPNEPSAKTEPEPGIVFLIGKGSSKPILRHPSILTCPDLYKMVDCM
jgi:hypothetical protein